MKQRSARETCTHNQLKHKATLKVGPHAHACRLSRSNTHEVSTKSYFQPESVRDLEKLVAWAHSTGQKIRPVGNGLSPNGIGFEKLGMVNIGLCDKVRALCIRIPATRP